MRVLSLHRLLLGTLLLAEIGLAVFLTGCGAAFDYAGLRNTQIDGDGFNAALAREYKEFALYETDEMKDWPDAAHFGAKALAAASGVATPPENPKDWRLPKEKLGEITAARVRLIGVLEKGADLRWPQIAAKAQARLDCWIEQQEENWQTDHIARCRNGFFGAIAEIDKGFAVSQAAADTGIIPALAIAGDAADRKVSLPRRFLVLFDFDSADLAPEAGEVLTAIAEIAGQGESVRVIVSGHADRAGSETFNRRLSWRRAESVNQALIDRGIADNRIALSAHGEQSPLVRTPDGVREPRNRRVEITVGPAPAL